MISGTSGTELGAGLDSCGWTGGGAWIRKESRGPEGQKTGKRDGDGVPTSTPSSKLSRGVRGIVSLRGLSTSHSERAGVEGADDPVGESG